MTRPSRFCVRLSCLIAFMGTSVAAPSASAMMDMPMQPTQTQQMLAQQVPQQQVPMQQMPAQQMPMMQMMQMMMSRMGAMPPQPALAQPGQGMPGAGPSVLLDRLDGRIAFLHAELRITQPQMPAWSEFANALRANAQRLTEQRATLAGMPRPADGSVILATLEQGESVLAARLEGLRAIRVSYGRLLAVLDDTQRRVAEELVWPHLGLS